MGLKMQKIKKIAPIIISLIIALVLPIFVKNNYYVTLLDQALVNIIAVIGLNFITGLTGQVNLGMAGIFAAGSYTSALLTTKLGVNCWLGLIASIIVGIIIGYVLGYPSLRIKGIYLTLTTIGFGEIMRLLLTNMVNITGGTQGVLGIPSLSLFGFELNTPRRMYFFLVAVVCLMAWIAIRIVKGRWGREFKAVLNDDTALASVGIDISKAKLNSFILCSVFTCVAGSFYAHLMGYIDPSDYTFDMSTRFLMMLMLGGIGSVPGSIIGGSIITILPEILRFLKEYYWLVFSVIILIIILVLPYGLVSIKDLPFVRKLFGLNKNSLGESNE